MATKVAEMTLQWFFSKMLPIQWAMFSTPKRCPEVSITPVWLSIIFSAWMRINNSYNSYKSFVFNILNNYHNNARFYSENNEMTDKSFYYI
jgi:hypothetical protein